MNMIKKSAMLLVLGMCVVSSAFADARTSYMAHVQLNDGKSVVCAVNQPLPSSLKNKTALSIRDQNEAEIDATAQLNRIPHSKSSYPSLITAPRVECS